MDAGYELQKACVQRMIANSAITALVGYRFYDHVPATATGRWTAQFPFIQIGPTTMVPDDADCIDGEEITIQFDVWSSGTSGEAYDSIEARKIANLVKRSLHRADIALADNALVSLEHVLTRQVGDPNPALHHFAVQFRALIETPGA